MSVAMPAPVSPIPAYLDAFPHFLARHGLRVARITLQAFLDHHRRCGYPPFAGWATTEDRILWGIWSRTVDGEDMIATWAVRGYPLLPGETLREMIEVRGLYPTDREHWLVNGEAARLANGVTDLAVFEGGLCIPAGRRQTAAADLVITEMGLFARASAVDHWMAPWVWFLVAKERLGERFAPERIAHSVVWTVDGEIKGGVTRRLGLSSSAWVEERAAAWLRAHPR